MAYAALALAIVLFDQGTKEIIQRRFAIGGHDSIAVIPGFFEITHIRNTGAAFGLFASLDSVYKSLFLNVFALAALTFVIFYAARAPIQQRFLQTGLHLIAGGAVGNLIDRIRLGSVVDFLYFSWRGHYWPAFNVADSAICVGVALLYLEFLRTPRNEKQGEKEKDTEDGSEPVVVGAGPRAGPN